MPTEDLGPPIVAYFMPTEDLGNPFLLALYLPIGKLFVLVSFQLPKIIIPVTFQNALFL